MIGTPDVAWLFLESAAKVSLFTRTKRWYSDGVSEVVAVNRSVIVSPHYDSALRHVGQLVWAEPAHMHQAFPQCCFHRVSFA